MVMHEYRHDRNMIALWKIKDRTYCWLNWRYVLTIEHDEENNNVLMHLMDNLCNEERLVLLSTI